MSKLPDLIVTPGNETPESAQSAEDVSKAVNDDLKKRDNRIVLGLGFKHLPVYFTACIKAKWNPELGQFGDYEFVNVHPDRIILDRAAKSNDPKKMKFIAELLTLTVQELVMRFPNKKKALFDVLKSQRKVEGEQDFTWRDMATQLDIWEVHFTYYKKGEQRMDTDFDSNLVEPGVKWERVEAVLWKYDDVLFSKIKTPNYDYEGSPHYFTYDDPMDENSKRELVVEEMMASAMTGIVPDTVIQEQVYHNYFQMPEKPYYFFGYDQWGKVAIDETSRIEQNLYNQMNMNELGKQVWDTLKTRVKHVWSTDSALSADDIQQLDMENPRLDALVDGNVNDVHKAIMPERPDQAQFQALGTAKANMFGLAGATALTGQLQSDTATSNQIAREQNFTRADDLIEDTINSASEWMARWALQFIKLRYTEEHFRKLLGASGQITFLKLKRDQIEDGMEVMIKSSSSDKIKAQRNAMEGAKLGAPYTNPLDFFKDMEYTDPEGRADRGMLLATDPMMYYTQVIMALKSPQDQAMALNAISQQQMAQAGVAPDPNNPNPAAPMSPTPTDTAAVPTEQPPVPEGSPRMM